MRQRRGNRVADAPPDTPGTTRRGARRGTAAEAEAAAEAAAEAEAAAAATAAAAAANTPSGVGLSSSSSVVPTQQQPSQLTGVQHAVEGAAVQQAEAQVEEAVKVAEKELNCVLPYVFNRKAPQVEASMFGQHEGWEALPVTKWALTEVEGPAMDPDQGADTTKRMNYISLTLFR